MWRKGSPLTLLMGIYVDIVTMEDSMEIPLKPRNKTNSNTLATTCEELTHWKRP